MLLTAFSNGCTAMTGVEAVSNGVPAFRPPESRNAAPTLIAMAVLSIAMFMGITLLAHAYGVVPSDTETVVSQIARGDIRRTGLAVLRGAGGDDADPGARGEHGLCGLSAAGVDPGARPVPAAPVHEPGRPPRVLERHPDPERARRRCCSSSSAATRTALIPLYMIGVFVSFTLSQAGMVMHWRRLRDAGLADERGHQRLRRDRDRRSSWSIVAVTKALEGAWIIIVMIPVLVADLRGDAAALRRVAARADAARMDSRNRRRHHVVLVPIGGIQRAVVKALRYARDACG